MSADYKKLRDSALANLRLYMDSLPPDKGRVLAYWVRDYTNFLTREANFQPQKLIRYKRGAVVKVHLGYRIGSEEGGLHYAIVVDKNNSINSPTLTVIPLTSVKPGFDPEKLHHSQVYLGNEIHSTISKHLVSEIKSAYEKLEVLNKKIIESGTEDTDIEDADDETKKEFAELTKQVKHCQKLKTEIDKMKIGSIALVGQITTVSKIRVYDPKYKSDALAKIRVSDKTLNLLDKKVNELFCNVEK